MAAYNQVNLHQTLKGQHQDLLEIWTADFLPFSDVQQLYAWTHFTKNAVIRGRQLFH